VSSSGYINRFDSLDSDFDASFTDDFMRCESLGKQYRLKQCETRYTSEIFDKGNASYIDASRSGIIFSGIIGHF
jgi:hypothetical protein